MKVIVTVAVLVVVLLGSFFLYRQMFPVDPKSQIPCEVEATAACI